MCPAASCAPGSRSTSSSLWGRLRIVSTPCPRRSRCSSAGSLAVAPPPTPAAGVRPPPGQLPSSPPGGRSAPHRHSNIFLYLKDLTFSSKATFLLVTCNVSLNRSSFKQEVMSHLTSEKLRCLQTFGHHAEKSCLLKTDFQPSVSFRFFLCFVVVGWMRILIIAVFLMTVKPGCLKAKKPTIRLTLCIFLINVSIPKACNNC